MFRANVRDAVVGTRDGEWHISNLSTDWLTHGDIMHMNTHITPNVVTFDNSWKVKSMASNTLLMMQIKGILRLRVTSSILTKMYIPSD